MLTVSNWRVALPLNAQQQKLQAGRKVCVYGLFALLPKEAKKRKVFGCFVVVSFSRLAMEEF